MFLPFEVATKAWESSTFLSTTELSASSTETKCQEPSAKSVRMHSPFIWSVTSHSQATSECPGLNGGKASDWLRLCHVTREWCSIERAVFNYRAPTTRMIPKELNYLPGTIMDYTALHSRQNNHNKI